MKASATIKVTLDLPDREDVPKEWGGRLATPTEVAKFEFGLVEVLHEAGATLETSLLQIDKLLDEWPE